MPPPARASPIFAVAPFFFFALTLTVPRPRIYALLFFVNRQQEIHTMVEASSQRFVVTDLMLTGITYDLATPDVVLELAERIPNDRRELPLLLSVGRLDPVKGMERIVAAAERAVNETSMATRR